MKEIGGKNGGMARPRASRNESIFILVCNLFIIAILVVDAWSFTGMLEVSLPYLTAANICVTLLAFVSYQVKRRIVRRAGLTSREKDNRT